MPAASDVGAFSYNGLIPNGTNVAEMTLGNGIWDLHANYTYSGLPNEATGQWGTLFINGAVAWLLLANVRKFYFISHISGDSWHEVFQTDGSVPMTGPVTAPQFIQSNYGNPMEIGQFIDFHQADRSDDFTVRLACDMSGLYLTHVDGRAGYIFGEHNIEVLKNYVLPRDGSVTMTGALTTSSEVYTCNGYNQFSGSNEVTIIGAFQTPWSTAGRRWLGLWNETRQKEYALMFGDSSGAYYNIFGTHNVELLASTLKTVSQTDITAGSTALEAHKSYLVYE